MTKIIFIIFIFLMLTGCKMEMPLTEKEIPIKEKEVFIMEEKIVLSNITIVDVYDNEFDSRFKAGFGFGAVVKLKDKNILFDTGGDSPTLLSNLKTAGIKPEDIDIIVLSHIHGDHTGGLLGFLEKNSEVKVYVPASFPSSFKKDISSTGATIIDISDSAKIIECVYSTGELGTWIKEQSLIIDSDKGLIIITGCAHPGIVNIVKTSRELMDKNVYLVMGGFHIDEASSVIKEFKELGVEKAGPTHCTGERAVQQFKEEYKEDFIEGGVGKIIKI